MAKAKAKAKKKPAKKKHELDWSDEESVATVLAADLGGEPADLRLSEERGLSSFGEGTVYEFKHPGEGGEWACAENSEAAEKLAIAMVKQDLEQEPEIFEKNFIAEHINLDRLRRDLHSDVYDMNYERLKEEADRRPMEFLKDNNLDIPWPTDKQMHDHAEAMSDDDTPAADILKTLKGGDAEDAWIEMGEDPEVPDSELETIAESETTEQLKDPVAYLDDIYGEDATKKAIEIAGIDEDAAAEEAVRVDGAEHFLARYDGTIHDGPAGIVYWRTN